jgi:hypothetical protein
MMLEIVCIAVTGYMMYLAMERWGAGAGVLAFIAGACLFGVASSYTGQEIEVGCVNHGHAANDC